MSDDIKFAVDKMLGRLARWLRVAGGDVKYGPHLSGRRLIKEARQEKRWILTRDRRLAASKNGPPTLLIRSDHFREQLREVLESLPFDPLARAFTRCVECNEPLAAISKKEVESRVPPYVFATAGSFFTCRRCHRIYWPATHREKMLAELNKVADIVGLRGERPENQRR